MNQSALIRPEWTPATIGLMVLGFVVFWPLGLAMLAFILFGEKLRVFKRDANARADGFFSGLRRTKTRYGSQFSTGNVAFDDWREKELARLDAERQKLMQASEEFEAYARELRRAKDSEEFDRFMASRRTGAPATTIDL